MLETNRPPFLAALPNVSAGGADGRADGGASAEREVSLIWPRGGQGPACGRLPGRGDRPSPAGGPLLAGRDFDVPSSPCTALRRGRQLQRELEQLGISYTEAGPRPAPRHGQGGLKELFRAAAWPRRLARGAAR